MKFTTILALAATAQASSYCPNLDNQKSMGDFEFIRKAHYSVINSIAKGWYHDRRTNVVNKQCFGDWMDTNQENAWKVINGLGHGDIWGIGHKQIKDATNGLWDSIFDNINKCQFYEMMYDTYSWCQGDIETCYYQADIYNRLLGNGLGIMKNVYQLYEVLMADDFCYDDEQNLAEVGAIAENTASIISYVFGFKGEFADSRPSDHLTLGQMQANLFKKIDSTPVPPAQEDPITFMMDSIFGSLDSNSPQQYMGFEMPPFFNSFNPNQGMSGMF